MRVATPQPLGGIQRPQAQTYTVRSGDTLSAIAARLLGNKSEWSSLYETNRAIIGSNPNRLTVGMVLRLPGAASATMVAQPPIPRPESRSDRPAAARDTFVRTPAARATTAPQPKPETAAGLATASKALPKRWTQGDVEFLARALSAESRGEFSKYLSSGDRRLRDSVVGIGYVIARKAEDMGTGIQQMIRRQPHFLSAWGQGNRGNNRHNFREFFKPTHQIANWSDLKTIAREALMGADPTGIAPNHYYDTSISAPRWARGPHVETKRIGKIVFVDTNE